MTEGRCVDCGLPTSGTRCRICNGRQQRVLAAIRMQESDDELLHLADVEKISHARLGIRYGVSRVAIWQRVQKARARRAFREAM